LNTWSLSLGKTFSIREGMGLQIRADADNIWNHANFALPANSLSNAGSVISTGTSIIRATSVPMRTMQLSAHFSF
jgi:hypothetical protein